MICVIMDLTNRGGDMDWVQFLLMLGAFFGLFIGLFIGLFTWSRSESRSDMRRLESAVNAQLNGMREEMKDFHGILYIIQERNNNK